MQLLAAATSFCDAFASNAPLQVILSHFSTTHQVSVREHGLPFLAPFLGRTFTSLGSPSSSSSSPSPTTYPPTSIAAYFTLLSSLLSFQEMSFGEWLIDTDSRKVSCKGKAKFTWKEQGNHENREWWDETFVYVMDFDEEGKVTDYQVWADSGAVYLASIGRLAEMRRVSHLCFPLRLRGWD